MARNWMINITDDLLDSLGPPRSSLPVGPDHVRCPASASDFGDLGPLPAPRRTESLFVPIAQYRKENFKP